jgi:hypothetical protein
MHSVARTNVFLLEGNRVFAKAIAILLVVTLAFEPVAAMAKTSKQDKRVSREQLDEIPIGKVVEVKLLEKRSKKITGMLLFVSVESFEIQPMNLNDVSR